ncbi:MAG: type II toxin-antitoxin system VapC family toxin [Gammaproteobacteria bacterium]
MAGLVLLDASALLVLLNEEKGADLVHGVLRSAAISTVNLAEVSSKLHESGMDSEEVAAVLDLGLERVPFDAEMAEVAGSFRPSTRRLGLSLGDRCCLATGWVERLRILTADRRWSDLDIAGITIECVR